MNQPAYPPSDVLAQRLADLASLSRRVAHDFDNILTGIVGFSELSLPYLATPSVPHTYLSEILRVCEQGIQLTRRLHYFHQSGMTRANPSDPMAVIQQQAERFREGPFGANRLDVQIAETLPPVKIDAEPCQRVLENLLTNAAEACPVDGLIQIRARAIEIGDTGAGEWVGNIRPGPHVEISVGDNGVGMSAEVRSKLIVEPFFTTKPRHCGLGLPVAFRILHAHQGGLRIESWPAAGCTVRIALPAAASKE